MAMIKCSECGAEVSDRAQACVRCGNPIAAVPQAVTIKFPVVQGQMLNTKCFVYADGREIAQCRQGETVTISCTGPMDIQVAVKGSFGRPGISVQPGDKCNVGYRGFGKIYIEKVDAIVGSTERFELF